jgi:hypothetical protein
MVPAVRFSAAATAMTGYRRLRDAGSRLRGSGRRAQNGAARFVGKRWSCVSADAMEKYCYVIVHGRKTSVC